MFTAVYASDGAKLAGDDLFPETLQEHILHSVLPLLENGCLYSRLSDNSISAIAADEKTLNAFAEQKQESRRMNKTEFIRSLLLAPAGHDVKTLCARYSLAYAAPRRVFVAETTDDLSPFAPVLEEMFEDEPMTVVGLDAHRAAVLCPEDETSREEMTGALAATFAELNTDCHIGVGGLCESADRLSESFEQALAAIRVGKRISYAGGVWVYDTLMPEMVLCALSPEQLSLWKRKAEQVCRGLDRDTIELIQGFFHRNLNISETARAFYLHRNTLIYRLDRIQRETGLNLRVFDEAVALRMLIAANKLLQ